FRTGRAGAEPRQFVPAPAPVRCPEHRGVLDAGVDGVGVGERRLDVPDALELPRVRRAVVPLVCAGNAVVDELVVDRFPGLAAVVGTLDELTDPAGALRGVETVRIGWRSLEVIHLPATKMRTGHVPPVTRAVGSKDERAFARSDQQTHSAHVRVPPSI